MPVSPGDASGREPTPSAPVLTPAFADVVDVASAHAAFRAWLFGRALPFWAAAGHDGPGFGAREHLGLDGLPADVAFKRMRVQARQIYVFSHAALLGWSEGARLARDGYDFICRTGVRADGAWVRRLSRDGMTVLDPAIDLYDQAFVLFALAWYARLTGEAEPLDRARRTLDWIRANMAETPAGFANATPFEPGPRQQNPHMHLLEATLALHETSADPAYADFAHELVALFRDHLFDPRTGTLGEFFAPDWSPAPGEQGDHVEPGHHYEWVWLLDQYERATGADATDAIDRLHRFALDHGTDPATALVYDVVARDGTPRRRSMRLWPQTEALKAHAVMTRRGGDVGIVPRLVRAIGARFLANCPEGAWLDQFDAEGRAVADRIPTSSFYHVMMGYAELDRLASAGAGIST